MKKRLKKKNIIKIYKMDPQKQKQMVSQLFDSTAKSQEELDKMTPEERREYLRGRLKQRMFFNGVSRQSSQQKKKMQDKMEEATKQSEETEATPTISKTAEKNKKKKEKKKAAMAAAMATEQPIEDDNDDVVIVKRENESDYESDDN
jgi:microsomal dipeptidase-like Zn-dependent dipeptidase